MVGGDLPSLPVLFCLGASDSGEVESDRRSAGINGARQNGLRWLRQHYRLMDLLTYSEEVPRGYEYPLPGLVQNTSISWTLG